MIFHGDCLHKLKELEANSVDAIVTDPPYGLAFMGKKWDYDVPSVAIWSEVFRVLKPGGHILSFGGTRTYHRMVVNIEDAGFEIRDQIQWIYGSGFPKSHNLKGEHEGWGTALKPANEPICLARKPLEKGLPVAENVLKYGTGAINVNECRIGTEQVEKGRSGRSGLFQLDNKTEKQTSTGRWPANVILDEAAAEMLDQQSGMLKSGSRDNTKNKPYEGPTGWKGTNIGGVFDASSGGASRFFYVAKASKRERNAGLEGMPKKANNSNNNPSRMVGSSSKKALIGDTNSTNSGVEPQANHHPTVKPIKLMEYLIKLITPPGGTVLDPFMGSGSTGVAAKRLGFNFIGIEMNEEYLKIAEKRIDGA